MSEVKNDFYTQYRGSFTSLLKWQNLDNFWRLLLKNDEPCWYVYDTGKPPPAVTLSADEFRNFIQFIDHHLRDLHKHDYCGIVYTDSKTKPTFIKIYDPKNLGVSCGIGPEPIPPGWIISLTEPLTIEKIPPLTPPKKPWWKRLLRF